MNNENTCRYIRDGRIGTSDMEQDFEIGGTYKCSECGWITVTDTLIENFIKSFIDPMWWDYCPCCGRKIAEKEWAGQETLDHIDDETPDWFKENGNIKYWYEVHGYPADMELSEYMKINGYKAEKLKKERDGENTLYLISKYGNRHLIEVEFDENDKLEDIEWVNGKIDIRDFREKHDEQ